VQIVIDAAAKKLFARNEGQAEPFVAIPAIGEAQSFVVNLGWRD
jgi:hypothetical protein